MKRTLLICAALVTAPTLFAQSKSGTSVGQFLLIEPSARITGMGNAGATVFDDIQSAYYNPAAIGMIPQSGVQFTHSPWIADIAYDFAALGLTLGNFGNVEVTVTSLNSGEIDVRTVEKPLGTGERYTVTDLAFGVGYGRRISEQFSVGVQISYLHETIWHSSMSAFAMSAGTLYRVSEGGLHIGASISNFGTRARFDGTDLRVAYDQNIARYGDNGSLPAELFTDEFSLPIMFRVGLAMPFVIDDNNKIVVAADAFHPSDNTESVSVGAEWTILNLLSLRGGYQNLFLKDSEVGLTLGAGLRYKMADYGLTFDYAWADHGRLEKTHRMTFGVLF